MCILKKLGSVFCLIATIFCAIEVITTIVLFISHPIPAMAVTFLFFVLCTWLFYRGYKKLRAPKEKDSAPTKKKTANNGPSMLQNNNFASDISVTPVSPEQIAEWNRASREKSEKAFAFYQKNINNVDPRKINLSSFDKSPLNTTEIFFLDYINGLPIENPFIAQYWYYDYGLNYRDTIKKLIGQQYLEISCAQLEKLKVVELKEILRDFNLPVSGKKADLCTRITSSVPNDILIKKLSERGEFYKATPKGIAEIKSIMPSATKNLELENQCLRLILDGRYNDAYKAIAKFKSQVPGESGIGIDWNAAYNTGLSSSKIEQYDGMVENSPFTHTTTEERDLELSIRAAMIFCDMFGLGTDKAGKLINRLYAEAGKSAWR